jgi:hypothetical protein
VFTLQALPGAGLTAAVLIAAALARIWDRQHDRLAGARRASVLVVRDQHAAWQADYGLSVTDSF